MGNETVGWDNSVFSIAQRQNLVDLGEADVPKEMGEAVENNVPIGRVLQYAVFSLIFFIQSFLIGLYANFKFDVFFHVALLMLVATIIVILRLAESRWLRVVALDNGGVTINLLMCRAYAVIAVGALFAPIYLFGMDVVDQGYSRALDVFEWRPFLSIFVGVWVVGVSALHVLPRIFVDIIGRHIFFGRHLFFITSSRSSIGSVPAVSYDMSELTLGVRSIKTIHGDFPIQRAIAFADLRSRGKRLRLVNVMLLGIVVIVLGAAAGFIVFAGQIAGKDTQSLNSMQSIQQAIENESESLTKLERERDEQNIKISKATRTTEGKPVTDPRRVEAQAIIDESNIRLKTLSERIVRVATELERHKKMLGQIESSLYVGESKVADPLSATNLLVAAGITRFGVLAVVIYLVQILVGLYRYNAQLASFYFSHADALLLIGESADDVGVLSKHLRPHVNFGKPEASLPEKVVDKIGDAVKVAIEKINDAKNLNKSAG